MKVRTIFSFRALFLVLLINIFGNSLVFGETELKKSLFLEINGQSNRIIEIRLNFDTAPKSAMRLKSLANNGLYDGVTFHRVINGFMAQTGDVKFGNIKDYDPSSVGRGGSQLPDLVAEFSSESFVRGSVGMARSQSPDSANSQFFLMFEPAPHLNGQYTIVGQVVSGINTMMNIKKGNKSSGLMYQPDYISKAWTN